MPCYVVSHLLFAAGKLGREVRFGYAMHRSSRRVYPLVDLDFGCVYLDIISGLLF